MHPLARPFRFLLLACTAFVVAGCAVSLPVPSRTGSDPVASALLDASIRAHGGDAFDRIQDLAVSYDGDWAGLVQKLQPVLVDVDYRKRSQERILFRGGPRVVQLHTGPGGRKHVIRMPTSVDVWYNGRRDDDKDRRAAAALVADAYRMFLTGPYFFRGAGVVLELAGVGEVDGRDCDLLLATLRPGLGLAAEDRVVLYIDHQDRTLRRLRFSLEGLDSTQGAVVDVDLFDHQRVDGVLWPTRFIETLRRPIPALPVHEWWVTGLDFNRGMQPSDLPDGDRLDGRAAAPARPFAGCRRCTGS